MKIPWYLMAKGEGVGGYKTASGPIAHWTDGVDAPLKSLLVNIDPVQEGAGDPSPDNVRPISGWSAVNVWVKPTYDPTANPTANLALGQTVYGGTLDVTNGVLTVDMASILLNEFSFDRTSSPERHIFRASYNDIIPNVKLPKGDYDSWDALCSSYGYKLYGPISASDNGKYSIATTVDRLVFIDHRCGTVEEFEQLNASVQLVYPLATPIEYTLTPQQISSLVGENNVWADTGDVTVEYESSGGSDPNLMKLAVAFMGR